MKFFVACSSKSTVNFSKVCNSFRVLYFQSNPSSKSGEILSDAGLKELIRSDAIVLNGTWGNELRKNMFIPKNASIGEMIWRKTNSYKLRSAILDTINSHYVSLAKEYNKPIVVFESSTISRSEKNYTSNYNIKSHFRLSLNSWIYGDGKWLEEKDFSTQPVVNSKNLYNHTWKMNERGSIYILTGSEVDPTSTMKVYDFLQSTIKTIRTHTERKIRIKLHPISFLKSDYENLVNEYPNVELIDQKIPLKNLYTDMYCAVIDNSTSIFELIDAGIPTYCSNVNFGRGLLNTSVETVNNPYLASKEEVLRWTNQMCCTEIPAVDFSKKETVKQIERLIERHYNGV